MVMVDMQDGSVHHMRVTTAGQISLPAAVRRRWNATRVRVIDEGGRLVVEPASDNPFDDLVGILATSGPSYDDLEAEERAAELERDRRKYPSGSTEDV